MRITKKKCLRWLKISSIAVALVFLIVLSAGFIAVYFFGDDLKQFAIAKVNSKLNAKIKVKAIDVSFFEDFPNISIVFQEVSIPSTLPKDTNLLAELDKVVLGFNLWSVLQSNYTIRKLQCYKGKVFLHRNKQGKDNFRILKHNVKTQHKSSEVEIKISRFSAKNVLLTYINSMHNSQYTCLLSDAKLKGQFYKKDFALSGTIIGDLKRLQPSKNFSISNKQLAIKARLEVKDGRLFFIQDAKINLEDLPIFVSGSIDMRKQPYVKLALQGKKLDIQSFVSLLPEKYRRFQNKYASKGSFYFSGNILGGISSDVVPSINVKFGTNHATIKHKPSQIVFNNFDCHGSFVSNGMRNFSDAVLSLSSVNGTIEQSVINGKFTLKNFAQPQLSIHTTSTIQLDNMRKFFDLSFAQQLSGLADLKLHFIAQAQPDGNFNWADRSSYQLAGSIILQNGIFKPKSGQMAIKKIYARLFCDKNYVQIQALKGFADSTDFSITGTIRSLAPWLFGKNQPLIGQLTFKSTFVNLNTLLKSNKASVVTAKNKYKVNIPAYLKLDLQLDVEKLKFRRFTANNIDGKAGIKNQKFYVENLVFNTVEGGVYLNGMVSEKPSGNLQIACEGNLTGINIKKLFYVFENFNQQTLKSTNLAGRVDAFVEFRSDFSQNLKIMDKTMYASAKITVSNGVLTDFAPLNAMSKYINIKALRAVKFQKLSNIITIDNRTVYVPKMQVHSSAMNLVVSGKHGFDNQIDYHINLLLRDLLAQKFKRENRKNEFGHIVYKPGTGMRLFLKMSGNAKNPNIALDSKGIRQEIKQDMRKEKQDIKQLLRNEFNMFKKDTTLKDEDIVPEKPNKNKVENKGFTFEM